MIPSDKEQRKKMIVRMYEYIWDNIDDLNSGEKDFIESSNSQFAFKEDLSDRQCEILEKIYDKL